MSGNETQFFQTAMGRTFFERTLPALVDNVGRIADRLETQERDCGNEHCESITRDDQVAAVLKQLEHLVREGYREIQSEDGKPEAEAWIAMIQGRLNEVVGYPVEGAGQAVKVLAVKRGLKRGAHLARAYDQPVPGVAMVHQHEVLNKFADALMRHADDYGTRDGEDGQ